MLGGVGGLRRQHTTLGLVTNLFRSYHGSEPSESLAVPLSVAAYQVWGANTDVGKTVLSAGLMKVATQDLKAYFLKPVQTGFPDDSDARLVAKACGLRTTHGSHALELLKNSAEESSLGYEPHTEFAWAPAVSPHLAVQLDGRPVSDQEIQQMVAARLRAHASAPTSQKAVALVETAGGPGSPGPSGRLQIDIYRPLRLPALLVGDGRLGGISTTLAAYEMLVHRGYDVACIALMEAESGPNAPAMQDYFRFSAAASCPIYRLPLCLPSARTSESTANESEVDENLADWLFKSETTLRSCLDHLLKQHEKRVEKLLSLPEQSLQHTWYPFTQHQGLTANALTSIDARSGENFHVVAQKGSEVTLEPQFDGCASWWTQGVSEELQPLLASEIMKGISRYGHVIHPQTVVEPVTELSKLLLETVGGIWGKKVFYSDDGSTAIEVALKMAFRKFWKDHPEIDLHGSLENPPVTLKVVGIDGGYHGDTLGAMDAVAPSPYNGPAQYPWYSGRGLFLKAPYVGLRQGEWMVTNSSSDNHTWKTLQDVLDQARESSELAKAYTNEIEEAFERYEQQGDGNSRIGACIIEPIIQGAGGMLFVDPVYQRCLISVARARGIPVIFDEVFTGLWRLGAPSAAEILGVEPDIACYAKLLTGGVLPLAATIASQPVFEAFLGPNKLDGLLHGHSYSGHCAGASAGRAALKIFSNPSLNPALSDDGRTLKRLWPDQLVHEISHEENVASVVAMGTVIAVELKTLDGGGYASSASADVVKSLKLDGVYARPLGSTVYVMLTPTTGPEKALVLTQKLLKALRKVQ